MEADILRNLLAGRIPMIYAAGYSCSQYLKELGIRNIVVYCEQVDYVFGQQICFDLSLCFDIDVKFWISDGIYTGQSNFPNQNLTSSPNFNPSFIEKLTAKDTVLILCPERTNAALLKIYAKTNNILHIADIWPDIWWRAIMARHFQEVRGLFPFLPVVIYNEPLYPRNKEAYSATEKFMSAHQPGHYVRSMLPLLKEEGAVIPKTYEGFGYEVDELIEMLDTSRSYIDGRKLKLKDYGGRRLTISNGHRIVPGQPDDFKRTIYVFGGCGTFGTGCPDQGTSPAHLQKLLIENGRHEFRVENYGAFIFARGKYVFETMKSLPYNPGDILVSSFSSTVLINGLVPSVPEGVFHVDTLKMFERPHKWGENIFFDTSHMNAHGQAAIASVLFEYLKGKNFFDDFAVQGNNVPQNISLTDTELAELDAYIATIVPLRPQIGSIVMNCNPFTLGHRYLIETSAKKCSQLFIFVVEEDKSDFPFAERIELVRQGTKDLPNVTVIPSGKFIISSLTFTDYFGKSEIQDRTVDPSMDVELFGRHITQKMGINIRFAGEEPLDQVTRQYNEAMQRILPQYGVAFEVIPRKKSGGKVISASRVRQLLKTSDFHAIAKLVPETTLHYLKERAGHADRQTPKKLSFYQSFRKWFWGGS